MSLCIYFFTLPFAIICVEKEISLFNVILSFVVFVLICGSIFLVTLCSAMGYCL